MLSWFRKKRQAIVPLITGFFLTGLFSFICPHCLAKMMMEANTVITSNIAHNHCSHAGMGKQGPVQSHKHCNGSCSCDDNAMLIGSRHPVTKIDNKGYPDSSMAVLHDSSVSDLPVIYFTYAIGKPYKPDRACYSPLERNCVLLN